jgi:4a-hydroxytetrahydrobiopterin dehydratase
MSNSNDDTLVNKKCVPCHGGVSALTPAEAKKKLALLEQGWKLVEDDKALRREFKFPDFYRTMSFVNAVAHVANAEDHHPDI